MKEAKFVVWKNDYATCISVIDAQHQMIMELINKFFNAFKSRQASTVLKNISQELINYCLTHFKDEEKFMKEWKFPRIAEHIEMHKVLAGKTQSFHLLCQTCLSDISFELLDFLKDWWTQHIINADLKFAQFIRDDETKFNKIYLD